MQQFLKLERPKNYSTNFPDILNRLFSRENPIELIKKTLDLRKNITIDDDKKTATLEIEKELKYGVLTLEMTEEGEFVYSMKNISKTDSVKLIYNLQPSINSSIKDVNPIKKFYRNEPSQLLTPNFPIVNQPAIFLPILFTNPINSLPYLKNNDYTQVVFQQELNTPSYQEKLDPLNKYQESSEISPIESNIEFSNIPIDMIETPVINEIPRKIPELKNNYKIMDPKFKIETYNSTQNPQDYQILQKISLNRYFIKPGTSPLENLTNTGLDVKKTYYRGLGILIDSINGVKRKKEYDWGLFVNGMAPGLPACKVKLKKGDSVDWVYGKMPKGVCFANKKMSNFYTRTAQYNRTGFLKYN